MRHPPIRLVLGAVILAGLFCGCKRAEDSETASKQLSGTGSTFVLPMMQVWTKAYNNEQGVEIIYTGTGSGAGIQQMIEGTVNFGCTDAPMKPDKLKEAAEKEGDVIHIPLAMGAVVPAYHLTGVAKPLRFDGKLLARIFLLDIKTWDHPDLLAIQEDDVKKQLMGLEKKDILTVHRDEASGTTFIFTDFLTKTSEGLWEKAGTQVPWKGGAAEKGNPAVAGYVKEKEGAIGYIELTFALKENIQYGAVKNAAKVYVHADLDSVTAAAEAGMGEIKDDLTFNLTNMPGEKSYPICGAVWAVMYTKQKTYIGKALYNYFLWVTHEGQELTAKEKYARLPPALQEKIKNKLKVLPH